MNYDFLGKLSTKLKNSIHTELESKAWLINKHPNFRHNNTEE